MPEAHSLRRRCGALHGGTWQCVPCASAVLRLEYGRSMDRASTPWSTRRVRSAHSSTCNTLATFAEYPPSTPSVPSPAARCSTSRRGPTAPRSRTRGRRAGCLRNRNAHCHQREGCSAASKRADAGGAHATHANKRPHARTNKQATGAHSPRPGPRTRQRAAKAEPHRRDAAAAEPNRARATPSVRGAGAGRGPVCLFVSLFACLWGADHTYLRPKSCR